MSVSELLTPLPKEWAKINVNSISTESANLNFGGITNVSTINGNPVPPFGFDPNTANIIYKPGSSPAAFENIVNSWTQVVTKVNQLNINQCLNVYIDSTIVNPAPINVSLDCKSRVRFFPASLSATSFSVCQINDGIILKDLREVVGTLGIVCESITGPNLQLSNGNIMAFIEGAQLSNTATSLVPSLQIEDGKSNVISTGLGAIIQTTTAGSLINVGIGSTLIFAIEINSSGQMYVANTISSTDGTANLIVGIDASVLPSSVVNAGYTGTILVSTIDKSAGVSYDDTSLPQYGSTNVQGVLDVIKGSYAKSNSSNPFTCGDLSCSSLSDSGTASITGSCSVGSLSSSGEVSCSRVITGDGSFGSPAIQLNTSATGFWNQDPSTIGLAMNGIIWAYMGVGGGFSGLFPGNPGMELGNSGNYWQSIYVNNVIAGSSLNANSGASVNLGRTSVTQATSNSTAVTANSASGVITMFGPLNSLVSETFVVNNSSVSANSAIVLSCGMAGQVNLDAGTVFSVFVNNVQNGSFSIQAYNSSVVNATNALTISFSCL
jgi:hypothetical protein